MIFAMIAAASLVASALPANPPEMVSIVPGSFWYGSLPTETATAGADAHYADREQPRLRVHIDYPFAIGRTEVTVGEFAAFVRATSWQTSGGCTTIADGHANTWAVNPALDWAHPGFAQGDHNPVVCVNLADAQAYTRWLSQITGDRYRLPSSTEWEYAARAGTDEPGWWDTPAQICAWGNVSDRARAQAQNGGDAPADRFVPCDDGHVFTTPVASYRPNRLGLYDMIGNVWEWTADCLDPTQAGAPTDGSPRVTGDCGSHIDRGASWTNSPRFVRLASRHADLVGARNTVLGFRVVRDRTAGVTGARLDPAAGVVADRPKPRED
jgi:formylglycine-generating enzyme required for sulfatase activity